MGRIDKSIQTQLAVAINGLVVFLVWWLGCLSTCPAIAAERPNMVVYLSDDHSQFDSSLYGNANIPTPQFERLAADGMTFTHAFVASPSCAPSRAAMLTGLMPARNGAEANHTMPVDGTHSLVQDLQAVGYEVVAFGKVAHGKSANRFGFDHAVAAHSITDLAREVAAYLEGRKSRQPLCLFVGTTNPHVPWAAESTFDRAQVEFPPHHLDTPETRLHRAAYYQEIKDLDAYLGELRVLTTRHLGDNTLFVHTSDHGSQWPFGKWNLYDYGTRVPFIAAWPGEIPAGAKSDAMISWVDLLPTLIELGGGRVPEGLDGRSFAEVLRSRSSSHRERIYTTHTGDGRKNIYPIRAVRTEAWKLIHNLHPEFAHTNHSDLDRKPIAGAYWTEWAALAKTDERARQIVDRYFCRPEWELYHVADDKWEQRNLAEDPAHADLLADLKRQLAVWMEEQGDQRLVHAEPRPLDDPSQWHPDYFRSMELDQARLDDQSRVLAPTSQQASVYWKYTESKPGDGWMVPDFDDAAWKTGRGPFGKGRQPGIRHYHTAWSTDNLWLRREFDLTETPTEQAIALRIFYDEDAEVYLNGTRIAEVNGFVVDYRDILLATSSAKLLRQGRNVLAIHVRQTSGGQGIDAGLLAVKECRKNSFARSN